MTFIEELPEEVEEVLMVKLLSLNGILTMKKPSLLIRLGDDLDDDDWDEDDYDVEVEYRQ